MTSQLDFNPGDYHLRVLIDQMERDGSSEHAIDAAVLAASDRSATAEPSRTSDDDAARDGAVRRLPERKH